MKSTVTGEHWRRKSPASSAATGKVPHSGPAQNGSPTGEWAQPEGYTITSAILGKCGNCGNTPPGPSLAVTFHPTFKGRTAPVAALLACSLAIRVPQSTATQMQHRIPLAGYEN